MLGNFSIVLFYLVCYYAFSKKSVKELLVEFQIINNISGVDLRFILKLCIDALVLIGGEYLFILTFDYSLRAEINQGVISSLFILSAVNTAIITWFLIGVRNRILPGRHDAYHYFMTSEKFNKYHLVSFIIMAT